MIEGPSGNILVYIYMSFGCCLCRVFDANLCQGGPPELCRGLRKTVLETLWSNCSLDWSTSFCQIMGSKPSHLENGESVILLLSSEASVESREVVIGTRQSIKTTTRDMSYGYWKVMEECQGWRRRWRSTAGRFASVSCAILCMFLEDARTARSNEATCPPSSIPVRSRGLQRLGQ